MAGPVGALPHVGGPLSGFPGGAVRSLHSVGPVDFSRAAGHVYGVVRPGYFPYRSYSGYNHHYYRPYGYYPWCYYLSGAYLSTDAYNAYLYDMSSNYAYLYGTVGASGNYLSGSYTGDSSESSISPSSSPATAESAVPADTRAYLTVDVPADARVWAGGHLTSQTGTVRQFYSPPLTPGQNYTYEIRARWMEDGRPVERVRQVPIRAGTRVTVDFMSAVKTR